MTWNIGRSCFLIIGILWGTVNSSLGPEEFSTRANEFSINLFKTISKEFSGNVVVSPISLELLLAQVYLGAGGRTAAQIQGSLGLPADRTEVLESHRDALQSLKNPVLNVANRIFVDNSFRVKEGFQEETDSYFSSPIENLDFYGNPDGARSQINQWMESHTNNKIRNILPSGSVDPSTKLVLANAIHFKADWLEKFPKANTKKDQFYGSPGKSVDVDMMHIQDTFKFLDDERLGAKILELPYKAENFRMVIILPNNMNGLAEVESKLSSSTLQTDNLYWTEVKVYLPKFKLEESMKLNGVLAQMGMTDMFSNANFSGITDGQGLSVSSIVQKALIELDEEGTEAAGGSAGFLFLTSAKPRPQLFKANHPFIVNILYKNLVLFMGSVQKF